MKRIAYLEDDDTIRENYTEMLRDEGFEVDAYSIKEDAITAFQQALPDLALLDMSLHGERDAGLEVSRELRRLSPDAPILFLTSHDDDAACLQAGATGHMSKAAWIEDVVVRVEALLTGRKNLPCNDPTHSSKC